MTGPDEGCVHAIWVALTLRSLLEPRALYCVLMLNTEVVVMEPRLMFCSRDTERETEKNERSLSLSVRAVSGDGELGCSCRLIEEQLCTLSSLIIRPVSPLLRTSQWHSRSEGKILVPSITISADTATLISSSTITLTDHCHP